MKNKRMLLKEEADDEVKFVDDDVFYSDEPVQVDLPPVETPIEPVVEPEVVHNAYTDILQDLLRKQWDVINACDMLIATLAMEENATFDKEAVTSILSSLADDITASVGMTTKAMSVVDPTQDELMKEGERKAEDAINASEKEVVEDEPVEPVEESLDEAKGKYTVYCRNTYYDDMKAIGKFDTIEDAENCADDCCKSCFYWCIKDSKGNIVKEQPLDEDMETLNRMDNSHYTGFDDLEDWRKYWAWYALSEMECMLDGLSDEEIADDEVLSIINDLQEDDLKALCIDVADRILDNDYIWETLGDVSHDIIYDMVHEGEYAERAIPTVATTQLGGGNNPNEGEE